MFIVFISRGYPSARHIQNGNFEATQAQALAKLGHKVIVIGVNCYSIKNYDILGFHNRQEDGIEIYEDYLLAIPSHNRMPFKFKSWLLSKRIDKILHKIINTHGKPDIIHSHYLLMTSAISRIVSKYHVPLVCTEHWSQINSPSLSKSIIASGKKAYEKVNRILAVSNQTVRSIKDKFGKDATVMYNMVDDIFFNISNDEPTNSIFTFIAIGEMSDNRKGFDILLRAFSRYVRAGNTGKLYLRGHGILKVQYEELAKELGINDNVEFLSEMSHNELDSYISRSHVVVMSSRIETFGVVLIEGMAKGKPVIATKCGGPEDFITEEMGILVPIENDEELANAMISIKYNYDSYDKKRIKELCYQNYSQESIANKIVEIYTSIKSNYV